MSAYPSLKTRVLQMLGDDGAVRYTDALVQEAMRQALALYNGRLPQVKSTVIAVTVAGRVQSLAALTGFMRDIFVIYPYTESASEQALQAGKYYVFFDGGMPSIFFIAGNTPKGGDQFKITYLASHTISALDAAAVTTLPAHHESTFVTGVAAIASAMRSQALLEAYGDRSQDFTRLQAQSDKWMEYFLGFLASSQVYQPSFAYPEGFRQDKWDKR